MATGEIVPNGDVTTQWTNPPIGDHYATIDEDRTAPNDSDGIQGNQAAGDDNEAEQFNFTSIAGVTTVSQVAVWTRGQKNAEADADPEINLDIGGWQGEVECNLPFAGYGWTSNTFAGLSASQSDLDGLQVFYRADVSTKASLNAITCVYCVVTYTTGYGHDYMGVPAANIGSVSGVPTANIASIKGV